MNNINRLFDIPKHQFNINKSGVAFVSKYNNVWKETTFKSYVNDANNLSKSLLNLGIKANDKIAIITDRNITEWHIIDLALLQIGVQSVPVYASTSEAELTYIFNHAEVKACFVANDLFDDIKHIKDKTPSLKHIISFQDSLKTTSLYDLVKQGNELDLQSAVDHIKSTITENYIATIIYTSGTTGMPKGVVLTHLNLISASRNAMETIPDEVILKRTLSLLPISHIFERLMLYMYQYRGITIFFAESIQTVGDDMKVVKPDIMSIVPRLLEKIHEKILEKGEELSGIKKYVFNWALDLGYNYLPDGQNGKKYERKLARARKLVFKKWQEIFGGNLKLIICGGSKLRTNIAKVFSAAGLHVMEGYALTETSGVGSVNSFFKGQNKIGTVGKPLKEIKIKIAKDGEILIKGSMLMQGYYKEESKNKKIFTNGFFKTGDLGFIDDDGFVTITGRKKELFKTSGGKYIAPTKIESLLTKSKMIEQVIVIGENEKFPAAIIQPNFEYFQNKHSKKTKREISNNQSVLNDIQYAIQKVNESLGQWEKIKKFALTPDEWTTKEGHLTPTMKIKRDVIKSKYYHLFNKIYR